MIQYNIATLSKRSVESSIVEITDLHKACRSGDLGTIKSAYKLDPSRINTKDEELGWTPLFRTVISGNVKASKFLLKRGSNANLANTLGETPLHQAADHSQYIIAELLLNFDADPNKQQNEGDTPLHHAAFRGDTKMIEILLRHNADPNIPNSLFGRTPLHFACDCGYEEAVLIMLQYKADPQLRDNQGYTPFQLASLQIQSAIESFSLMGTMIVYQSPEISSQHHESGPDLPVTALSRWLDNLNLGTYYQDFLSVGYDDLETILAQMKSFFPLTLQELKKIGIKKLGHRYRIIIKLEEDTGIHPIKSGVKNNWQCCSVPRKTQFGFSTISLRQWLGLLKLQELEKNFIDSGFDDYFYLLSQMKSRYPISDQLLETIGITKPGHKSRIIGNLTEEIKDKMAILVETSSNKTSCDLCLVI
jgi:Ankyrin repeats (3 copies)/SAM domain (Sterile alpha motif)